MKSKNIKLRINELNISKLLSSKDNNLVELNLIYKVLLNLSNILKSM